METQVRTPQLVFMQPQRLIVPLFQRRYVWTQESQWEPLWNDVVRVAERILKEPRARHQPHFLGAVVLQQVQNPVGLMQPRTIIDGQQRLTTLQLLLDAFHAELLSVGALAPAARLEPLVTNSQPFCIHTLGNLTLLTGKLNSKVSNGPWLGNEGKRSGLEAHDVLMLNRELVRKAIDRWTDESIRARTRELSDIVISIWPVPVGHRSPYIAAKPRRRKKIHISDLIAAGALDPGALLIPRSKKFADQVVTLLPDGRIEVNGTAFTSPSDATSAMTGHQTNGWWFFLVDPSSRRSLRSVRRNYVEQLTVDIEDDETDEDVDEGEV
jgi:hypothetical protein